MSWWSDLRVRRELEREAFVLAITDRARDASRFPIALVPPMNFGAGVSFTSDQSVMLRETQGIPETATRAISNRISGLNPQVVARRADPEEPGTVIEEVLDDHPLQLLLNHPHPNFSKLQLLRLLAQWIVSVGDAYLIKVRNGFGLVSELHPVPPTFVSPRVGVGNVLEAYFVTDANGHSVTVPASQMVRFWYPDPEAPWTGKGALRGLGIAADAHKFSEQHLRVHFQKDATPKTVLEAAEGAAPFKDQETKDRWGALWREHYDQRSGARAGIPAITPPGYKLIQLAMQSGADLVPILEYLRDELLMGYGVPRSVLGQVVSGDRSSAETNQWIMDRYAVEPVTSLIADALTSQLARDFAAQAGEGVELLVRFEDFVSHDKEYELQREAQDLATKVRSVNKVLEDRGEDPVDWGEEPVGTPQDVPYDPDAAAARLNRPPAQSLSASSAPPAASAASAAPEPPRALPELAVRSAIRALARNKTVRNSKMRRIVRELGEIHHG